MNIKHLFFCMLLIAFSSCSKPGYEKAIAEWVQTDSHGTWTDLKFELLEVLETEDVFRLYGSRKKPESNGCHESHVPAP